MQKAYDPLCCCVLQDSHADPIWHLAAAGSNSVRDVRDVAQQPGGSGPHGSSDAEESADQELVASHPDAKAGEAGEDS